ncbi:MAG: ATP-binding protein [Sedimentisphaerales bacterium]
MNDNIVKLHESSRRAATAARNSGVISIILFVVGSIIAIVVNSIFISRLVAKRITALHEGVKIIGDGNLDYHIAAVGDDELSDLARASNEMVTKLRASQEYSESVINTVREPLISLDQDLRVVTVSRSFCEFFKVKPEDTVGQLIYDLGNKQWDIPKLRELLETILPQKSTFDNYEVEHDFTTIGKRTMLLNARQIQRASGKERIILLAIDDITEHKKAQQAIEEARVYAENIVETIQEPLIVLDTDLKVISANSAFYQTFKVNHKETEGQFIYDLGNRQWNIPRLRQLLEDVLPRNSAFDNYEIEHDFETIGPKTMLFNARRLDSVQMILITIYDITERKRAEEKLQKNEEQFIERKKIEIELKEANEQLIKFNDLKDEFVSIASHELRTPLSIISGAVKLLIDEIPGKIASGQKEILDMAMRNLDRLARIVDALLSISKIESGKTELYRTDADICRLITETVDEYNLPAGKKHINLSCQLPAHPVILHADADRIKEVISNLLSNSLKFTPEGGSINVCCEDRNDDVFVFVKDTGCGVAKNDVPRLFEKFTQFNRKVGPGEKGTGLGLAICKGLVNLHNGKIWAESDTGSGMKVSFTIPRLSAEYIFTESVDNAVTSSLKTGGGAAVVLVSTKPVIQIDSPQMQAILKDVSGVLERNLRRNAHDTVIQNTKEVLVVLENCDIVEAAAVCQRLTQAIECHLADKDLSSKLDLLIGYAAYPDDGQTGQSLIEKAREAGVACLPSNKA